MMLEDCTKYDTVETSQFYQIQHLSLTKNEQYSGVHDDVKTIGRQ